jgi:dTDP-glucose 4,6-dehydratase
MDHGKISRELGRRPQRSFQDGLRETIRWYRDNQSWLESVRTGAYRSYYERQYGARLVKCQSGGRATMIR